MQRALCFLMTCRITHLLLDLTLAGAICWEAEMKCIRSQIGMAEKSEDIRFRDDHIFRVWGTLSLHFSPSFLSWVGGTPDPLSQRWHHVFVLLERESLLLRNFYPQSRSFQSCLLKVICLKTSILSRHPSYLLWLKVEAFPQWRLPLLPSLRNA